MFNFHMQKRHLKGTVATSIKYPATLTLRCPVFPAAAFGAIAGAVRTAFSQPQHRLEWDERTDRGFVHASEPLHPIQGQADGEFGWLSLSGNILEFAGSVSDQNEAMYKIWVIGILAAPFLNLVVDDAPIIPDVRGSIDGQEFEWRYAEYSGVVHPHSDEELAKRATNALGALCNIRLLNQRVLAAANYYHKACRLLDRGETEWEFMQEAVLNLAKSLEIVFPARANGRAADAIRSGLRALEFEEKTIEAIRKPV